MRKRRPQQPAQLRYSTRTPDGMGNRTGTPCAQFPSLYTRWRAQRPAGLPPAVPRAARRHKAPTPVGADLVPTRPVPPPECPEALRSRPLPPGPHRPFWAARDRSRRRRHRPASRESVRGLPDHLPRRGTGRNALTSFREMLRDTMIGCHLWRSRLRIIRSALSLRERSNLTTGVCNISP